MFAVKYSEVREEISEVALSIDPQPPADDYAGLVREFEQTAEALLTRVSDALENAYDDHGIISNEEWKQEARFLADELGRYPWLLVNIPWPPKYATLKRLYEEWAWDYRMLGRCLRELVINDGYRPTVNRIYDADIELSAATASTAARSLYLDSLAA